MAASNDLPRIPFFKDVRNAINNVLLSDQCALSRCARTILHILAENTFWKFTDSDYGTVNDDYCGQAVLAKMTGFTDRTVRDALDELEHDAKLISRKHNSRKNRRGRDVDTITMRTDTLKRYLPEAISGKSDDAGDDLAETTSGKSHVLPEAISGKTGDLPEIHDDLPEAISGSNTRRQELEKQEPTNHHQEGNRNPDDDSSPSALPETVTVESIVAEFSEHFPEWDIDAKKLTDRFVEVCTECSATAEEISQVTWWWYLATGHSKYSVPVAPWIQAGFNPPGYLYDRLPRLVNSYRKDSAAKAKELGLDDPASFDYSEWCEQNCIRADEAA